MSTYRVSDRLLSREGRLWVYGVVIAALFVIAGYEIIDEGQVGLWSTLAASLLGVGGTSLAVANVPPKTGQHRLDE